MDFQNEIQFIVYACESFAMTMLPDDQTANIETRKENFEHQIAEIKNWDWLVECARRNSVAPIIFHNIKQIGLLEKLPMLVAVRFENLYKESAIRNLKLRSVFIEVAGELLKNEIQPMPLKGIVLQKMLYPDPVLRAMVDLDIIVKQDDALKAFEILKKLGCREIVNSQSDFIGTLIHHFPPLMYKNVAIELHRSLTDSFDFVQFPEDELWNSSEEFEIENFKLKIPNKYLLLIYLCHHVYSTQKGGTVKLIWYFDIFLFLNKYGSLIDWEYFKKITVSYNAEKSVYHSLGIVRFLFKSIILSEKVVVEAGKFCPNPSLIFELIMNEKVNLNVDHYYLKFKNIKGFKNKARYVSGRLFPGKGYLKTKYNVKGSFGLFQAYLKEFSGFIKQSIKAIFNSIANFFIRQKLSG